MTDEYSSIEDAIETLLKTLTGQFSKPDDQVSQGDDSILAKGFPRFALLRPGKFTENPTDFGETTVEISWETELYLYSRYETELATTADLRALRSAVLNLLWKYPTLNNADGVLRPITVDAHEGFGYVPIKGMPEGAFAFMAQKIDIITPQVINRSGGEF